jgi:ACS family glucarate transporter-like MFS transporter
MLQYFASNFTFFLCFTWLLPYLRQRYQLGGAEAGLMAAVPLYFGVTANWISGAVVDRLFRKGWGRLSRVIPAASGFLIGAVAICGAAQARTPWASVLAIAIATFGVDLTLSPSWTLCIDIAGVRTGTLSGAMNMCGNIGSFASSLALGHFFLLCRGHQSLRRAPVAEPEGPPGRNEDRLRIGYQDDATDWSYKLRLSLPAERRFKGAGAR